MGLSLKDKADTLERLGCCSRCTSWSHKKDSCSDTRKCGKFTNGVKCEGEHSHLVCGSNNAYCGAAKPILLSSSSCSSSSGSSSDSDSDSVTFPNLNAETLLMFEDIVVRGAGKPARVCWDKGSIRCLVTHQFTQAWGLQKQDVVYRLDGVGKQGEAQDGLYYMFELVKNDGSVRKVWAYGIDMIMEPPEPMDLSATRCLFPHVPNVVFKKEEKKHVDILMGNNFLGLHPDGDMGL